VSEAQVLMVRSYKVLRCHCKEYNLRIFAQPEGLREKHSSLLYIGGINWRFLKKSKKVDIS
jgi:hypothetical protein